MSIKQKATKLLSTVMAATLIATFYPSTIHAQENNPYEVIINDNKQVVINHDTNQSVSLEFTNDEKTEGIWTGANGVTQQYKKDANGSIYLDGVMVVEAVREYRKTNSLNSAAATSWTYVTTFKTKQSIINNAGDAALLIIGLVPGMGTVAVVIGAINLAKRAGASEVYIKIDQYISHDYRNVKNVTYYYSDANYSKLITSHEAIKSTF
ncbi:hypothetical protein NST33_28525 [Paenibacillus sp. FSL L8-0435]|uniref:hypothetical protein n=1 Tax=Paenibacillus TaxID=44249 RepID=UPI001C8D4C7D|nr:hypothetical protein [Paenibacillus xylanexedens]MBY0117359.1 hypothetical protein [Paenibacillus xylanexedens]